VPLIRLYAAERATDEERPADREHAMGNLLAYYLRAADAAREALYPHRIRVPPREPPAADPVTVEFADSTSAGPDRRGVPGLRELRPVRGGETSRSAT